VGDATVATGDAISDLTLAGLDADRGAGRDAWLPTDIRKMSEAEKRAETSQLLATGKSRPSNKLSKRNRGNTGTSNLPDDIALQQVAGAAEITEALDDSERHELLVLGMREKLDDEERHAMGGAAFQDDTPKPKNRTEPAFPNPLKGQGDFGSVSLRDPLVLDLDEDGQQRIEGLDPRPSSASAPTAPTAPTRMSYQSIARAREEGRRLLSQSAGNDKETAGKKRGLFGETAASEARRKWAEQRGDKPGGAANFYNEVTVTPKDMQVYALLDRARRLRERQEKLAQEGSAGGSLLEASTASGNSPSVGFGDSFVTDNHAHKQSMMSETTRKSSRRTRPRSRDEGGSTISFSNTDGIQPLASESNDGGSTESIHQSTSAYSHNQSDQSSKKGPTWRGRAVENATGDTKASVVEASAQKFEKLDDYLRGNLDPLEAGRAARRATLARSQGAQEQAKAKSRELGANTTQKILSGAPPPDEKQEELYFASVLICDSDGGEDADRAKKLLEKAGYFVDVEWDGRKVIEMLLYQGKQYDCLLIEKNCSVADGYEVTEAVRNLEKERRLGRQNAVAREMKDAKLGTAAVNVEPFVALPIIAFTADVSPDDLRSYIEVGMDGCVSKPMEDDALLATVRAAAPQHGLPLPEKTAHAAGAAAGGSPVARKVGILGTVESGGPGPQHMGSSAMAAHSLSLPASFTAADGSVSGVLQLDEETALPYTVIDFSMSPNGKRPGTAERHAKPFFNLVVCHDLFDTLERLKIVLSPLAARYPGLQILLWNYPGQAFTEWRPDQLLNNDYLASCLNELLRAVGPHGTKQFDCDKPFHMLGFGNGASVATFYIAHYTNPHVRSLIHCNGFAFVDPHLAGALHDCMNVFSCAPAARPDLPVYFYSRFLFSPAYLASVSTPLALNLYTAVHNPISLEGRIQLCLGTLSHADLRPHLAEIDLPIVAVQATQGALVKPVHGEVFVEHRRGGPGSAEAKTIYECLKQPHKTCVVWVKSGHEVFQEARDQVVTLIEQMITGYHETHDVAFQSAVATDPHAADSSVRQGMPGQSLGSKTTGANVPGGGMGRDGGAPGHGNFEDAFIDNVLGRVRDTVENTNAVEAEKWDAYASQMHARAGPPGQGPTTQAVELTADEILAEKQGRVPRKNKIPGGKKGPQSIVDPNVPSFERQDNSVYKPGVGSRIYPSPEEFPEVKEYMTWRLKRNRKRLQRLDHAARIIQGAFRSYLAWSIVRRLREARAAAFIQRLYRGWKGRLGFLDHMRLIWAAQVVQRAWRGFAGRKFFDLLRRMHAAAAHIQRVGRGYNGRRIASQRREARRRGALKIQGLWRKRQARRAAFVMKKKVLGARTLQRVYRGHLGRRRATHEREKFLFSKSQSQGIEFGRQMLLEHKLHATRLQSEVQLLTQEKVGSEEQVEALLEEISEFEEAVSHLEKEMHDLSRIETEAVGVLDEDGRFELREQKSRLDREFGEMLAKIGDRRERLSGLEAKLATLDRARQGKEEELRTLERKLVVLLDEQQRELESIKRRQEKKGELLLKTQDAIQGGGGGAAAGAHGGPSAKDKQQAAQLMESTETLMKFGFMSMSMTYFSSLNMIRAMRNVSATDTVMAALHENAQMHGNGGGGGGYDAKLGGEPYRPQLRPGQMPGDEALKVSAWSVDDVARWLQTLSLGQYREAFIDASVDGAFLYDLDEDDLKNTLGIEHRLHRKKILGMINRLKMAEAEKNRQLKLTMAAERAAELGLAPPQSTMGDDYLIDAMVNPTSNSDQGLDTIEESVTATLKFDDMAAAVRHTKLKILKEAFSSLPNRRFDAALVKAPYVENFGTAYVDAYEMEAFNMNKVDEFGNSMLLLAAQNGAMKIAKLLIEKGANPNHQNHEGQTAGHYANAYGFYELLGYMYEPAPDGAGADDTRENSFGYTAYDGLRDDG